MSALFRQEVLNARRGEWLGTIRLATPLSHRLLTVAALAFSTLLVLLLIFGHYTKRESAAGTLVPAAGLLEVTAAAGGIVSEVAITEGSSVHAGDPVITLSVERISATLGNTAQIVTEQLKLQRARLDADVVDQEKLEREQTTGFENRIGSLRAQLSQLDGQIAIQQRQAVSARSLLEKIAPLRTKGYVSAVQIQQQESAALDAESTSKALARQRLDAQQQLTAAQDQLSQLPLTASAKRHELESKRADVDRALAENEVQRATVLRAPKDGLVASLLVKAGQTAAAGQQLLVIVPKDSPLQAQLHVPSRAIGFIQPGNSVVLRYQAYPYQKFGLHLGRVKTVSRSAMTAVQITNLLGQQIQEAMYRVDVELDAQTVSAYGADEALKPGMALDADIMLDRRRLIEWVFEPLYGMGKKIAGIQQ